MITGQVLTACARKPLKFCAAMASPTSYRFGSGVELAAAADGSQYILLVSDR
jgi:hypothetical protein